MTRTSRRALQFAGILVAALGGWFVLWALIRDWPQVSALIADTSARWLLIALGLGVMALVVIALVWTHELRRRADSVSLTQGLTWYFIGELAKYLPGGIWSIMGRAELATRGGVGRAAAYTATLLSLGATFGAALLVVLAGFPFHEADLPLELGRASRVLLVGALLVMVAVGLLAAFGTSPGSLTTPKASAARDRPLKLDPPELRVILTLLTFSIPAWFLMGLSTWAIALAFGIRLPLSEALFATSLAWFVGFIIVPVPSGIGVREAVLVFALSSVPPGTAATIAAVSRTISMASDVVGAGVAAWVVSRNRARR